MRLNTLLGVMGVILLTVATFIFTTAQTHPTDAFKSNDEIANSSSYQTRKVFVPQPKKYEFKDINGDGIIDISDLNELIKYIKKLDAMDINDDGDIDLDDVNLLKEYMFPQE